MSALSTHHEPLRFLRAPHRTPWRPVRPPQRRPRRRLGARESADVRLIASRHYLIEAARGRPTRAGGGAAGGRPGGGSDLPPPRRHERQGLGATVAAAEDAFGPVSVLVNNAGIVRFGPIAETEPAVWRQVIDINLTGTYLGIRAIPPSMRKAGGGAIVNISSAGGMMAYPNNAAYVASKWGARGLTKTAALELGRDNIRVNSIHPGPIRTPMTAGPDAAAAVAAEARHLAIARVAEPDETTRLVLFVASDEASFSTGSEFIADGGVLLGPAPQYERAETAVARAANDRVVFQVKEQL